MKAIAMIDNSKDIRLIKGESYRKDGRYDYRWTGEDGNRHVIYSDNLVDLRAAEERIHYIHNMKTGIDPFRVIVNDLYDWWAELKIGIYDTTMMGYKRIYEAYIRNSIGKMKLIDMKHSDVKRFYGRLLHDRRVSIETVSRVHLVLHQVIQFGVNEGFLSENPSSNAGKEISFCMNKKPSSRFALDTYEEEAFLQTCREMLDSDKWWPLFTVMFETGMRVSEISGLTWEDVDFEKNYIQVNHALVQSGKRGKPQTVHPMAKTAAGNRKIPLTDRGKEALLVAREYQKMGNIQSKVEIDGYKNFVFLTRECKPFGQQSINRSIRRIVDKYNYQAEAEGKIQIRFFTSHIIRHTFGTRLCENNANIKFIQYVMGHKDVQTTIERYSHLSNLIMEEGTKIMQRDSYACNLNFLRNSD